MGITHRKEWMPLIIGAKKGKRFELRFSEGIVFDGDIGLDGRCLDYLPEMANKEIEKMKERFCRNADKFKFEVKP